MANIPNYHFSLAAIHIPFVLTRGVEDGLEGLRHRQFENEGPGSLLEKFGFFSHQRDGFGPRDFGSFGGNFQSFRNGCNRFLFSSIT